jgi:hypothetical protein
MVGPIGAITLVATLLVSSSSIAAPADPASADASADDCLAAPNSATPRGGHWYYHIDRATHRKCWYLDAAGQPTQQSAAQPQSDTAPAAQPPAMPAPPAPMRAARSADAAMSTSDGAPPPPHITMLAVKPKPAPNGAKADNSVAPGAQQASAAQAVPQAFASPGSTPQAAGAAPTNSETWPDPAVTASAPQAAAPAENEGAASAGPDAPVQASDGAESAVDNSATATSSGMAAKSLTPTEMFLILVIGLGAVGFLFGVAIKIVSDRRVRITVDHSDSTHIESAWIDDRTLVNDRTWVDDQHQHNWPDDQQHYGSVDDRGRQVGAESQVAWINDFPTERIQPPAARPQARPQNRRRHSPQDALQDQPRSLDRATAEPLASADDVEIALRAIRRARSGAERSSRELPLHDLPLQDLPLNDSI